MKAHIKKFHDSQKDLNNESSKEMPSVSSEIHDTKDQTIEAFEESCTVTNSTGIKQNQTTRFQCKTCNCNYSKKENLLDHIKKVHLNKTSDIDPDKISSSETEIIKDSKLPESQSIKREPDENFGNFQKRPRISSSHGESLLSTEENKENLPENSETPTEEANEVTDVSKNFATSSESPSIDQSVTLIQVMTEEDL